MAAALASPDDATLLAQAAGLTAEADRPAPVALEQLSGGRNNRVFRLTLADDSSLVLKSYFRHQHDPRDRLGAEWDFLTFAWARGVRCLPEPLACDRAAQLGLYGFVGGAKLPPEGIARSHVEAAADFVCAVNQGTRPRAALKPGSEACFSLADHLERVDRRVERLRRLDPQAPHVEAAAALVADRLVPHWQGVKTDVMEACSAAGATLEAAFPESEIIASPSDFGFHNALWQSGRGLTFLDFEYAGWDDPAKLAGDFFNCPEIPTPPEHFGLFVETLSRRLALGEAAHARMYLLRDAYRIKWACIVLNDFLPHDDARRHFANQGDREARCAVQLAKAESLIAKTAPV
ncbi:phosphotransferase [Algihabitans albus]|uniref:phosphotransferase n=1 Tax=Algihabitans albus TaxID=2164067 RepID=UPI0035CFC4B7